MDAAKVETEIREITLSRMEVRTLSVIVRVPKGYDDLTELGTELQAQLGDERWEADTYVKDYPYFDCPANDGEQDIEFVPRGEGAKPEFTVIDGELVRGDLE